MKKIISRTVVSFLAVGLVVMSLAGAVSFAATDTGAAAALSGSAHTLEEMLTYAIEDEYLAQAEYALILDTFDVTRPFSNIIKAEGTHIRLLTPLLAAYDVEVPEKDWASLVSLPGTLAEAYKVGVEAEVINIAMYEQFLQQDLPDDVEAVFERLKAASEKHLAAFQRQVDGKAAGLGYGRRNGNGFQQGNRAINQANKPSFTGICLQP
ncbi:MAG: DUF2202 domain-containing protein [Bacillota bacterium]|nr:DUF2202 domain-containing protein [Bacillota bacterium]MDW7678589.1 DUF2202 domain-containing protein [Bacillota bacterium]